MTYLTPIIAAMFFVSACGAEVNAPAQFVSVTLRIMGLHKTKSGTSAWMILGGVFVAISIIAIMKLRSGKMPQESSR